MTPEGKIKDMTKKLLKKYGAWYFMPVSNGLGAHGIPDIICCHMGKFIAIETKAPGKKPTALQALCHEAIRKAWGEVFVVDGEESLKEVEHALFPLQKNR